MAVAEAQAARFELGRAAKRTFEVVSRNVGTFSVLALLAGVPLAVMSWGGNQFAQPLPARLANSRALGFYAVAGLLYLIGNFILQAGVVQGAVATLMGKNARLGSCLSVGVGKFMPLLLLTLIMTVSIFAAALLLVVPGIIVALMWSVALPAYVVEHTTIGGALNRSQELTRGHRWAIFGLMIVVTILAILIEIIFGAVGGVAAAFSGGLTSVAGNLWIIGARTIAQMIVATFGAALYASIYYELRVIKEGVGPEALASVFD